MRYLSVCSGIEAASVAWGPLGWKAVGVSEIEPFPCSVLKHHYPDVPNFGDMTQFKEWDIEPGSVDVLVGGTPCQSFSIAGLRGGLEDGRGNLALTYCRILQKFKPRWFIWENVPGVLSSWSGDTPSAMGISPGQGRTMDLEETSDFASIIGAFSELGYGVSGRILDAQYFGVPQRRRRVFVVGYLGDWRRAAQVLFEPGCLRGDTAKGGKKKSSVAALTATGVGTCGADDNQGQAGHLIAAAFQCHGSNVGPMGTFRAGNGNESGGVPFIATAYRTAGDGYVYDEGDKTAPLTTSTDPNANIIATSTGEKSHCLNAGGMGRQDYETETMVVAIQERAISTNPRNGPDGIGCRTDGKAYTLEARSTVQAVAFAQNQRDEVRIVPVAGALSAQPGMKQQTYLSQSVGVRRLTPRECERLQGFPDNYTNVMHRGKPAADGNRYKSLGNSMAVVVMAFLGKRIDMVDAQIQEESTKAHDKSYRANSNSERQAIQATGSDSR